MARRGAGATSVIALDAPRTAGAAESITWVVGGLATGALLIVGLFFGEAYLGAANALCTALNVLICVSAATTAFLVYSHAASSRNRAYLSLASTYTAVAWSAAMLLAVTPGSFVAGESLLGDAQSAAWTTVFLHTILPLGVGITASILWFDGRRYRRPGRGSHVGFSFGVSLAVLAAVGTVILLADDILPALVDPSGAPSDAWRSTWIVVTAMTTVALVAVMALGTARYSIVAGWMIAVVTLALAGSVVNVSGPDAFTVSWLVSQVLCVAAVILVPLMMLIHLGRIERKANRVADEDHLTGLTSRVGLLGRLQHEIERASALDSHGALLWVDLDGFKAVNDQFGHAGGDEALRRVASRLRTAARPSDTVARLAGDEFGLLVADLHEPGDAEAIAQRALRALREPVHLQNGSPLLTASIGIVHFPDDGTDADRLLHLADVAMYAAKHDGGDSSVTYDEPMAGVATMQAMDRQRLARGMRDDTFELHYQPMVDLETLEPVGAEALLRWQRDGELVPASMFVPLAESTGQIRPLGRLVLRLLAEDMRSAPELPEGFRVAVNLSVPELADAHTTDLLCEGELAQHLGRLTIEVTEGVMLANHVAAVESLIRIREAGAVIALDDFGSGFANVEALAGLDPDLLKVDSAFTRRAGAGETSGLAFLSAAHAIGGAIGAKVLAEGIETERELETVRHLGIDLGQGVLLGAPQPDLRF